MLATVDFDSPTPEDTTAPAAVAGVRVTPLRQSFEETGKLMPVLRHTDPHFGGVGAVAFVTVLPGTVRGWHRHRSAVSYAVPVGRVKLVLVDDRAASPTRGAALELFLGPDNYQLVSVPPGVWAALKGCGPGEALVCQCAADVGEADRRDPDDGALAYDWGPRSRCAA